MESISTRAVLDSLTAEGFRITAAYLAYLTRERVIPSPAKVCGALVWGQGDVARIKSVLMRRGRGPRPVHARGFGGQEGGGQ